MKKQAKKNYCIAIPILMLLLMIFDFTAVKNPDVKWLSIGYYIFPWFVNPLIGFVAAWYANADESPRQRTYDAAAGALLFFGVGFLIIATFGLWFHVEIGGSL